MNNEPAFPALPITRDLSGELVYQSKGITIRDYFAARATEQDIKHYERSEDGEMVGTDTYGTEWRRPRIIYHTREQAKYRYADAMMEARDVK